MILKNIFMYLAFINVLAFACFGIDKQKAKTHQWRISEKTLLGIAICGGSVGAHSGHAFLSPQDPSMPNSPWGFRQS